MSEDADRLSRRLERERAARAEAEEIAERVTAELYDSVQQLSALNRHVEEVNQTMRDFVAIASHDLRGPITAIMGFSGLMDDSWEDIDEDKKRHFVEVLRRQSNHLNLLIEDLLTISQIEAGALDDRRETVGLAETLRRALDGFTTRAREINLSVADDYRVLANPDHVRRILVNYLENALKYGNPPIEVHADDGGDVIDIRVCDAGDGVPDEFVERLFARFARADTPATREQKGTGLGLSIVQGLARANGGDAWYEPNSPNGACFCVKLPKAGGDPTAETRGGPR